MAKLEDFLSLENLNKLRQTGEMSDIDRVAQKYASGEALSSSEIDLLNKSPERLQRILQPKKIIPASVIPETTETGFTLGGGQEVQKPDVTKARLQQALKTQPGELIGSSYTPKSNFEQIVQRLEPSMKMSSETPNVSSKLQALETPASPVSALSTEQKIAEGVSKASKLDETMGKLSNLSEGTLSKLGPIGQKILSTKLLTKGLPALGAVVEGRQLPKDIKKGQYLDAVGSGLGLASGLAGVIGAGVPASILGAASIGAKGATSIGKQMAEYDVGEMGMPIPSKTDLMLTSGNGPFSDSNKYLNFLNSQKKETKNTDEELNKRVDSAAPLSKEDSNKENVDEKTTDLDKTAKSDIPLENQAMLDSMALDQQQSESTVEALRQAQEDAKKDRAQNRLMMAANEILRGALGASYKVARPEISNKFWEERLKESDQPIKDLLTRVEQEKEDPNSPISKRMREIAGPMLSRLNIKLPETATYAELQKNFPLYTRMISEQAEQETKAEQRQKTSEEKIEKQDINRFDKLSKQLDPSRQSGRSQLGRDAQSLAVIQNAKALLKGEKNLNDIDSRQVYEVVRQLDRVVSGGQATITASEHLDPQTFQRQVQTFLEKLTNARKGAKAGSFLKANLETFDREEQVARERLEKSALAGASSYKDLMEKYPEKWDEMMADQGLDHILSVNKINEMRQKRKEGASPESSMQSDSKAKEFKPGDIVSIKGKRYKVLSDGDSLEEIK